MNKEVELAQSAIKNILPQYIKIDNKTYQLCDRFIGINVWERI